MSELDVSVWDASSPDPLLITAVRQGDATAFGVLYARHADAARTVARQYLPDAADVEDVVADGFEKVLQVLRSGSGPDVAFRAYLFTVVRRLAFVHVDQGRRTQPTDEDYIFESAIGPLASVEEPTLRGFEDRTVALAFESLPERWRSVLWYTDIEGQTPAAVAPIFGLTPNGLAALAYRAREALRQAYLQQHLQGDVDDDCHRANALLGSYVRGGLNKRETALVEAHLDDCGTCRALVLELGDVAQSMRGIVAPLVLGITGMGALAGGLPLWGAGAATGVGAFVSGGAIVTPDGGAGSAPGGAAGGGAGSVAAASAAGVAGASRAAKILVGAAAVIVLAAVIATAALTGWFSGAGNTPPVADPGSAASPAAPLTPPQTEDPAAEPSQPALDPDDSDDADADADDALDAELFPPLTDGTPPWSGTPSGDGTTPWNGTPPWNDTPPSDPSNTDAGPNPNQDSTPSAPTQSPTDTPTGPPQPGPSPTPSTGPTPTPNPTSTPGPTPPPVPPAVPASADEVQVALDGLIALNSAPLRASVQNTSANPADGVVVDIALPAGQAQFSSVAAGSSGQGALRIVQVPGGRVRTASGAVTWSCNIASSGATASCTADALAPGASSTVDLDVTYTGYGARLVDVGVTVRIGDDVVQRQVPTPVQPAPAKLTLDVEPESELVAGHAGWLTAAVNNRGEVAAADARLEFTLPAHVQWRQNSAGIIETRGATATGDDWQCAVADPAQPAQAVCKPLGDVTANPGNSAELTEYLSLAVAMPTPADRPSTNMPDADVQAQAHWAGKSAASSTTRISPLRIDVTQAAQKVEVTAGGNAVAVHIDVRNSGTRAAKDVAVALALPDGIAPVAGCEPADAGTSCVIGDPIVKLAPGASQRFTVQLTAPAQQAMGISALDAIGTATVWEASPVGEALTVGTSSADLWVGTTDFGPSERFTGNVAVAEIGAPLLFCDESDPACAKAGQGVEKPGSNSNLNNDAHRSYALNEDPHPDGPVDGGVASSSVARLRDVPAGAQIKHAELFWSANDWGRNPPGQDRAYLKAPGGEYKPVMADGPVQHTDERRPQDGFYAASADVTDLVQNSGVAGDWSVANIGIDPSRIGKKAVYAGWSLVVIYEDASVPTGEVTLYDGALSLRDTVSKELALSGTAGTQARVGVVAWEGDRGILGDFLKLNDDKKLIPQRFTTSPGGDFGEAPSWTPGAANNAFDSTATGFRLPNSMGVDAKAFQTAELKSGRNSLTFGTDGDAYLLTAVTVHTTQP